MIERILTQVITDKMWQGKAIIVLGARQVGKTTMIRETLNGRDDVLWMNGDEPDIRSLLGNVSSTLMKSIIGNKRIVVIDEAQRISDIGICLKLITDNIPDVQVIASGSSSFDLSNKINEPLTGRKFEYSLYPLSFSEMVAHNGLIDERRMLPQRLIYGYYPDVVCRNADKRQVLSELADSYVYKDILLLDKIKKSDKLTKLLQALAFQIGSEVSFNELSRLCGLDAKTIDTYVALLEQAYIIFRLGSFSRNLRNELKFSRKIYFWDCGIRNAIIGNYNNIESRTDAGALFENFIISERLKMNSYKKSYASSYFWRTTAKSEIDYIEECDGGISAFEFKWNPKRKASAPLSFTNAYPNAEFKIVTRDNFETFLL